MAKDGGIISVFIQEDLGKCWRVPHANLFEARPRQSGNLVHLRVHPFYPANPTPWAYDIAAGPMIPPLVSRIVLACCLVQWPVCKFTAGELGTSRNTSNQGCRYSRRPIALSRRKRGGGIANIASRLRRLKPPGDGLEPHVVVYSVP